MCGTNTPTREKLREAVELQSIDAITFGNTSFRDILEYVNGYHEDALSPQYLGKVLTNMCKEKVLTKFWKSGQPHYELDRGGCRIAEQEGFLP